MNSTCTCGAALPEGSEFCPMCGRPLSEEAEEAERARYAVEHVARDEDEGETASQPIGFGNASAVRASYLSGLLAAFLGHLPYLHLLCFIWYPASGFLSVYLYRRKSGGKPNTKEGLRLGAMTGVLTFVITLVLGAMTALIGGGDINLSDQFREQIEATPAQEEVKRQMLDLIENPAALATVVIVSLIMTLAITVSFSALGGALGAKVLEDDRDTPRA